MMFRSIIEATRAIWGVVNGRWFVWRHASDDLLETVAGIKLKDAETPDMHELIRQAKEELRLRGNKQ
jgi:hypothetical protein